MTNNEFIEEYLSGSLNPDQVNEFELKLDQDSNFRQEFEFQRDIVDSLRAVRKAELKAKLNNIEIGTGFTPGNTAGIVKITSAIIIATGLGIWGYMNFSTDTPEETITVVEETDNIGEQKDPGATETDKEQKGVEDSKSQDQNREKPSSRESGLKKETSEDQNEDQVVTPIPIQPEVIEEFPEDQTAEIEIPQNELSESTITFTKSNIEVEIQKEEEYDFHYRFVEDRLFLYGSFDDEPYEIIEIREEKSDNIFLYYKEKFYAMDKNRKIITALQEIVDEELKNKLERIKDR